MKNNKTVSVGKTIITLFLLYYVLKSISLEKTLNEILSIGIVVYLLAFIPILLFLILSVVRLKLVYLLITGNNIPMRKLLKGYLLGSFFNLVLPTSVGGDYFKGSYLSGNNLSKKDSVLTSFIDRFIGLSGLLLLGFVFLLLPSNVNNASYFYAVYVIFILSSFLFIVFADRLQLIVAKIPLFSKALPSFTLKTKEKLNILLLIVYSSIIHIINVSYSYVVGTKIGFDIPFTAYLTIVPLQNIILALPITISGIGLREVSAITLYATLNISEEKVVALTSAGFSQILIIGLIGGAIFYLGKE